MHSSSDHFTSCDLKPLAASATRHLAASSPPQLNRIAIALSPPPRQAAIAKMPLTVTAGVYLNPSPLCLSHPLANNSCMYVAYEFSRSQHERRDPADSSRLECMWPLSSSHHTLKPSRSTRTQLAARSSSLLRDIDAFYDSLEFDRLFGQGLDKQFSPPGPDPGRPSALDAPNLQ